MMYKCIPSVRTASLQDTTGYTWGKTWETSEIRKTLPDDFFEQKPDLLAERWIVSDDPTHGSSIIINGYRIALATILAEHGEHILGRTHIEKYGPHLGMVMKILDTNLEPTKGSLSVQVHPAPGHPTLPPKPEMWYGTGSFYVGLKEAYTNEEIQAFCDERTLEQHMHTIVAETRQRIIILGGTLHAIRFGSTLYEWSYSPTRADTAKGSLTDATIGLYDATDGKTPRPGKEQQEKALEVMHHAEQHGGSLLIDDTRIVYKDEHITHIQLFSIEGMIVEKLQISAPYRIQKGHAFSIYVEKGDLDIRKEVDSETQRFTAGEEGLIAFGQDTVTFTPPSGSSTLYLYYRI